MPAETLILIAFVTSTLTSVASLGGGMLLVACMPSFLPIPAIVPVHGVVQVSSNVSRAAFGLKDVQWKYVFPFTAGSLIGAGLASQLVLKLPAEYFPIILGIFVLCLTWLPVAQLVTVIPGRFFSFGIIQTFISMFVGPAGPLSAALLYRENIGRDPYVVTSAVLMGLVHSFKVIAYVLLGFVFSDYWVLLFGMIVAATLGSYVGTKIRPYVSEELFRKILKVLLTVLSVKMLITGFD